MQQLKSRSDRKRGKYWGAIRNTTTRDGYITTGDARPMVDVSVSKAWPA